jgi:dolichyl-phosphate beta-glucosyltransferase
MFNSTLTLVLPAYNEERLLPFTLETLADYLPKHFSDFSIIVVDDGSTDGTGTVVHEFQRKNGLENRLCLITQKKNSGKGCAVKEGIIASQSDLTLFMDSDLPYELNAILKIVAALEEGSAMAIGSRELPESKIETKVSPLRYLSGQVYSLMIQAFMFRGIPDTQCGIKGFQSEVAKDLFQRMKINNFGFDVELLFIARRLNYSIRQIPVTMIDFRPDSRVRIFRDSLVMFLDLLRIRWNDWTGQYILQKNMVESHG